VFTGALPSPAELSEHYARYPAAGPLSTLTVRRYHELVSRLERFRQTSRLLDIGCGDGHFLVVAREHGWSVYGSEYGDGPRRRAQSNGLDVRTAPFSAGPDELASFDVVTAIEVIEHVAAPLDEMKRVTALLRPGGCLYLTTPNFASLSRRLTGAKWRAIECPEHLTLFTPRTLDYLLTSAGLERMTLTTTGISPSDLRAGLRSTRPEPSRRASGSCLDQRLRARAESSRMAELTLHGINLVLSRLGVGDTIKALYVRE
jgi:2-polyprenyl-3-methyl-5-hydroxy-6-metoxy-1,4-benzoquinol methylase